MSVKVELVELDNRVVEVTLTRGEPDAAGRCRQYLTLHVISGPPLTKEEASRVIGSLVAELVSRGADVHGWSAE